MPSEGVILSKKDKLLTTDEVIKISNLFVREGVNKIRLTGGEPTVRKDLEDIICKYRIFIINRNLNVQITVCIQDYNYSNQVYNNKCLL